MCVVGAKIIESLKISKQNVQVHNLKVSEIDDFLADFAEF